MADLCNGLNVNEQDQVVSIGHFPAFYVVLVQLEYIPTIPPHSTHLIVLLKEIHRLIFTSLQHDLYFVTQSKF